MSELDPVVREFLVESHENLDQLDCDLVLLEKDPENREMLGRVFRTIHTIKGTCGFFDFAQLGSVAHAGEGLLSRLREGRLRLNPEITGGLLALVDAVRGILAHIERTGQEGNGDFSAVIGTLVRLQEGDGGHLIAGGGVPPVSVGTAHTKVAEGPPGEPYEISSPEEVEAHLAPPDHRSTGVTDTNIRVDVGLLDRLMNLVGELVLARNQIVQFTAAKKDPAFLRMAQRLNLITSELQEGVMKTRMQPIGNLWKKLPRVVRDLSRDCAKQVRVVVEGEETELDKTILEAIKDPLTHLVRNAIDHGIETPELRRSRGKAVEGNLFLRAFHEGGQVNIEITDDGEGIDPDRVRQKALERGLISPELAPRLSERDWVQLVFLPGFSTADRVTTVSGRGIGMDVVKTNIEKIGGTVDLQSRPGRGTTVIIKIPLTLAIIPAVIVASGGDRYAIPQASLVEMVRLAGEQARRSIEDIRGAPVYRLRNNLLPLVYLNQELKVESRTPSSDEPVVNIVVLQANEGQFGLVVDGIHDTVEIVVKPLAKQVKGISLFAGATIMGDGKVALILDVLGIAQSAGVASEMRDRRRVAKTTPSGEGGKTSQAVLLFRLGPQRQLALPLAQVARLEEIPPWAVEKSAGQEMVLYRGQVLPLFHLGRFFGEALDGPAPETAGLHVVIYSGQGRQAGLVVDRLVDVVEAPLDFQPCGQGKGILGSVIVHKRITDLLDVPTFLRAADPSFFGPAAVGSGRT